MPEISRFLGIIIRMYYGDHPPKHFHVEYNSYKALISIGDLMIIEGNLPPRVHKLVLEWATMHRDELLNNWERATKREKLEKIKPLE